MSLNFLFLRKVMLFSLFIAMGSMAFAGVNYLMVNFTDGTNVSFALADDPKISIQNDELTVETVGQTIIIKFADLENYNFYDSTGSNLDGVNSDSYRMENGKILFDGLKSGEKVVVYDCVGNMIVQTTASADGNAVIDTTSLPVGIFLIRTARTTIKFLSNNL